MGKALDRYRLLEFNLWVRVLSVYSICKYILQELDSAYGLRIWPSLNDFLYNQL